uniref:Uncharacterized protein n=1 Tax=Rhodosorus marinus TaxID=101924 RepID=A0A7S2ZKW8_9RHOD|mmetsp:Transcript_23299/g.92779  ORF Transcript_23299/g.92779 Transcript_23299/m.92779 type:complete len:106 (+) Transcript_23299:918-1235(+)
MRQRFVHVRISKVTIRRSSLGENVTAVRPFFPLFIVPLSAETIRRRMKTLYRSLKKRTIYHKFRTGDLFDRLWLSFQKQVEEEKEDLLLLSVFSSRKGLTGFPSS